MSTDPFVNIVALVADRPLRYLPRLNQETGSKEATILLLQILERWEWTKCEGRNCFYKFNLPCDHELYRRGDSWAEETGFGRWEIETALTKIGTRIKQGDKLAEDVDETLSTSCVLYYTNRQRVTYYQVNERAVLHLFAKCYPSISAPPNVVKPHYISNVVSPHYISNGEEPHYISNEEKPHYIINSSDNITLPADSSTTTRSRAPKKVKAPKPPAAPKPEKPRKTGKQQDHRSRHPAINMLRGIAGTYPQKVYWDDIIALADPDGEGSSNLDRRRLTDILSLFLSIGELNVNYLVWFFDWYVNGVPHKFKNRDLNQPLAIKYRRKNGTIETGGQPSGPRLRKALNE